MGVMHTGSGVMPAHSGRVRVPKMIRRVDLRNPPHPGFGGSHCKIAKSACGAPGALRRRVSAIPEKGANESAQVL